MDEKKKEGIRNTTPPNNIPRLIIMVTGILLPPPPPARNDLFSATRLELLTLCSGTLVRISFQFFFFCEEPRLLIYGQRRRQKRSTFSAKLTPNQEKRGFVERSPTSFGVAKNRKSTKNKHMMAFVLDKWYKMSLKFPLTRQKRQRRRKRLGHLFWTSKTNRNFRRNHSWCPSSSAFLSGTNRGR